MPYASLELLAFHSMARLRKTHITCTLLAKVKGKSNERVVKLNLYHKEGERGGSGAVPEEI